MTKRSLLCSALLFASAATGGCASRSELPKAFDAGLNNRLLQPGEQTDLAAQLIGLDLTGDQILKQLQNRKANIIYSEFYKGDGDGWGRLWPDRDVKGSYYTFPIRHSVYYNTLFLTIKEGKVEKAVIVSECDIEKYPQTSTACKIELASVIRRGSEDLHVRPICDSLAAYFRSRPDFEFKGILPLYGADRDFSPRTTPKRLEKFSLSKMMLSTKYDVGITLQSEFFSGSCSRTIL